jgi:hypothetical protein
MKYLIAILMTSCLVLAAPLAGYAGNRPAWHSGGFSKKATLKTSLNFARTALEREHLKILYQDGNTLIAGNDNVIAQVSCSPVDKAKTWVVVSAYSNDSSLAEGTRNRVREYVVKTVLID